MDISGSMSPTISDHSTSDSKMDVSKALPLPFSPYQEGYIHPLFITDMLYRHHHSPIIPLPQHYRLYNKHLLETEQVAPTDLSINSGSKQNKKDGKQLSSSEKLHDEVSPKIKQDERKLKFGIDEILESPKNNNIVKSEYSKEERKSVEPVSENDLRLRYLTMAGLQKDYSSLTTKDRPFVVPPTYPLAFHPFMGANPLSIHSRMASRTSYHGYSMMQSPTSHVGNTQGTTKRKRSWSRAVFSALQRKGLEKRFEVQKYVTKPDRRQLAAMLGLTDAQVKVWFQNRRMKWRHVEEQRKKRLQDEERRKRMSSLSQQSNQEQVPQQTSLPCSVTRPRTPEWRNDVREKGLPSLRGTEDFDSDEVEVDMLIEETDTEEAKYPDT